MTRHDTQEKASGNCEADPSQGVNGNALFKLYLTPSAAQFLLC